jgi:hypothetical protein
MVTARVDREDQRMQRWIHCAIGFSTGFHQFFEWATEIKVRAERRAGELLRDIEKRDGGDAIKAKSSVGDCD